MDANNVELKLSRSDAKLVPPKPSNTPKRTLISIIRGFIEKKIHGVNYIGGAPIFFYSLRFADAPLEQEYLRYYFRKHLKACKIIWLAVLVLWFGYVVIDFSGPNVMECVAIRIASGSIMGLFLLFITFYKDKEFILRHLMNVQKWICWLMLYALTAIAFISTPTGVTDPSPALYACIVTFSLIVIMPYDMIANTYVIYFIFYCVLYGVWSLFDTVLTVEVLITDHFLGLITILVSCLYVAYNKEYDERLIFVSRVLLPQSAEQVKHEREDREKELIQLLHFQEQQINKLRELQEIQAEQLKVLQEMQEREIIAKQQVHFQQQTQLGQPVFQINEIFFSKAASESAQESWDSQEYFPPSPSAEQLSNSHKNNQNQAPVPSDSYKNQQILSHTLLSTEQTSNSYKNQHNLPLSLSSAEQQSNSYKNHQNLSPRHQEQQEQVKKDRSTPRGPQHSDGLRHLQQADRSESQFVLMHDPSRQFDASPQAPVSLRPAPSQMSLTESYVSVCYDNTAPVAVSPPPKPVEKFAQRRLMRYFLDEDLEVQYQKFCCDNYMFSRYSAYLGFIVLYFLYAVLDSNYFSGVELDRIIVARICSGVVLILFIPFMLMKNYYKFRSAHLMLASIIVGGFYVYAQMLGATSIYYQGLVRVMIHLCGSFRTDLVYVFLGSLSLCIAYGAIIQTDEMMLMILLTTLGCMQSFFSGEITRRKFAIMYQKTDSSNTMTVEIKD